MANKELYIGTSTPKSNEVVWIRPLKSGGVALYAYVYNKWQVLKLVNGKGTLPVDDDEVIDPATPGGNYYTKGEIDEKIADILGIDADQIDELIEIVTDDDTITGLLTELKNKANVTKGNVFNINSVSDKNEFKVGGYGLVVSPYNSSVNSDRLLIYHDHLAFNRYGLNPVRIYTQPDSDRLYVCNNPTSTAPEYLHPIAYLEDIPTVTPQVQSDWNEDDTTSAAYINNKPTIPSWLYRNSVWNCETATSTSLFSTTAGDAPTIGTNVDPSYQHGGQYHHSRYYSKALNFKFWPNASTNSRLKIILSLELVKTTVFIAPKDPNVYIHGDADYPITVYNYSNSVITQTAAMKTLYNDIFDVPDSTTMHPMTENCPAWVISITFEFDGRGKTESLRTISLYNPNLDQGTWALYEVIEEPYVFESTTLGDFNTLKNKPNVESASLSGTTPSLVTTGEKYTWNNKQNALVSGTNIKTINSTSIVGSGNVSVGTVTGITMNSASKGTSGTVDLGTVITGVKLGSTTLTPSSGVVTITTTSNVTSGNNSPITSGGVYTALQSYLTTSTANSTYEKKTSFTGVSSLPATCAVNTYYRITSSKTSLSITLPSSSTSPAAGDTVCVSFASGPSITTPTVTSYEDADSVFKQDGWSNFFEANTRYEIVALYDGGKWLVTATKFKS